MEQNHALPTSSKLRTKRRIPSVDVGEIRRGLGLTERAFAERFGFSVGSILNWEAGVTQPYPVASILLAVIAQSPAAVEAVLAAPSDAFPQDSLPASTRRPTAARKR